MEHRITSFQCRWASHTLLPKLPVYLRIAFVLLIGLGASTCGVVVLARSTIQPPSPFASLTDVFPRKPRSAIETQGFVCPQFDEDDYGYHTGFTCVLRPTAGPFAQVGVVVSEGVTRQTIFTMRPDTLRVGDLMVFWGNPEIRTYSRWVYLLWRSHRVFAWARDYTGQISPFLPVWRIYFSDFLL